MKRTYTIPAQVFDLAIKHTSMLTESRATQAAKDHIVHGKSVADAAGKYGISKQAVNAAVQRVIHAATEKIGACPCCGSRVHNAPG